MRIGTCSWADDALAKWFYPPKLPAKERLAWYAEHFDTVEVDSTFYRLPSESMVAGWAERTVNGSIQTDLPITVQGRLTPRRLEGRIGQGGRDRRVETVNGVIRIRVAQ